MLHSLALYLGELQVLVAGGVFLLSTSLSCVFPHYLFSPAKAEAVLQLLTIEGRYWHQEYAWVPAGISHEKTSDDSHNRYLLAQQKILSSFRIQQENTQCALEIFATMVTSYCKQASGINIKARWHTISITVLRFQVKYLKVVFCPGYKWSSILTLSTFNENQACKLSHWLQSCRCEPLVHHIMS